ncbi:response regulator [Gemella bergeri]
MAKILIVDDSAYYRKRGAEIAKMAGFECYFAKNGKEAIEMFSKVKPDVVTMDICMPILDGLEATRIIHDLYPTEAKILICSSVGHVPTYKRQAFNNGAVGVLSKEYDIDDLEDALSGIELLK